MSRNCDEVYIPCIEPEQGICPEGYRSSDCVMMTSCFQDFPEGTLTEFGAFLQKMITEQNRTIHLLGKQIANLNEQVKALKMGS
jgi:hypothetical protein